MERKIFKSRDGKEISLCTWNKVESPKGIVQISHGMAEHIARYDDFAKYLNSKGFVVAGDDHRAHGKTDPEALGKGETLFENTVSDMAEIIDMLKKEYKLPVILLGHSYGSFLTQSYLTKHSDKISGVILMGSALMKGPVLNLGHFVAGRNIKKGRADEEGTFFANLTFKAYDKHFNEGRNAWLSRDAKSVEKYNNDKLCGFTCSNGFYYSMFKNLKEIAKIKDKKSISNKNLKMLIVSGEKDPVSSYSKLAVKLSKKYKKLGLSPKLILYKDARHEVLNETNKKEVYNDLTEFVNECVK